MSEPYRSLPPKEGDENAVVIATRATGLEAQMAREYLRSHGIDSSVQEPASYNPIMNEVLGGSRILVRQSDAALAQSLLTHLEKASENDTDNDDGEIGEVRCPRCELAYCFYEKVTMSSTLGAGGALGVAGLFALLYGPFAPKRWRCHKCLHVWDDAKEGPARITQLDTDDPRPVFRLRRGRAGTGLFFGLMLMVGTLTLLASRPTPIPLLFLTLLFPVVGLRIGKRITTDLCSAPGCRAELLSTASECPVCRGFIAGTITAANEHYAESAQFRRELAELKANEANATKKARAKKKPSKPIPT